MIAALVSTWVADVSVLLVVLAGVVICINRYGTSK